LPWNAVPVPIVPELPTCQNTLHGSPLPAMITEELEAVVIVLPIWKIRRLELSAPRPHVDRDPRTAAIGAGWLHVRAGKFHDVDSQCVGCRSRRSRSCSVTRQS
jgi:hypothetical protein